MLLHPDIAALRGDDTPQREAQAALTVVRDAWSGRPDTGAILADLARFADPAVALGDCAALAALFAPGAVRAQDWVAALIAAMVPALADAPLGHVPLRHYTNGVISTLLLGQAGEAMLALGAIDGVAFAQSPLGPSASFAPLESWEAVLAGHGVAEMIKCDRPGAEAVRLDRAEVALAPGQVLARRGAHQVSRMLRIDGCLVTLRLHRRARSGGMAYEYDLASGRLLHRAAGVMRESRHALMANLLGRMGRADAAPVLAEIVGEEASDDLRWQALREGLGLDTARGFAVLGRVARTPADPLAAMAQALRGQLVAQYPALAALA
jgi:hypothetical protein